MTRRNRIIPIGVFALALGTLALVDARLDAQSGTDVQQAVDAAYAKFRGLQEGKNADYIPALAKVDPNLFGIAVVTADGKVYTAGDDLDLGALDVIAGERRNWLDDPFGLEEAKGSG